MSTRGAQSGPVVLTVDGNADIRQVIVNYLKNVGCEVEEADGPAQALELAKRSQPRLILSEAAFAEGDSVQMVRSLREDPDTAAAKVILVTREVRPALLAPLIQFGVSDFILKPFTGAELYAKINKVLGLWKGAIPEEVAKHSVPWPQGGLDSPEMELPPEGDAGSSYVTLPQSGNVKESEEEGDSQRGDVLVIDDMVNVARRFRELIPSNVMVEGCLTAEDALKIVRTKTYRVILIDLSMPKVDSGMLLRQISLFQTNATFYALGLKTAANLVEDARTLGFDGVLTKPFESSKVIDLVDRYFESKDKIQVEENVVTIGAAPMGAADRLAAFYYRICNDIPSRLELVAEACYNEVIINALELRGTRKNVIEVLVKLKEATSNLGLDLFLVVTPEVVGYSREFIETKNLPMFSSIEDAQDAISRNRGERA
ncbi:MAG: response regulator [Deltaproteobacteria bacterium]|nr:response regulator [Deltaproteobacteria bacterium]